MSKAILILEKHEHCIDCPLLEREYGTCVVTGGYVERMIRKEDRREIPCPLKPIPSKLPSADIMKVMAMQQGINLPRPHYTEEYQIGYNDCIAEILGE